MVKLINPIFHYMVACGHNCGLFTDVLSLPRPYYGIIIKIMGNVHIVFMA